MERDRIVVGVDGSAPSRRALEWAIELAAELHAEIVAVHAADLGPAAVVLADARNAPSYDELRHRLEAAVRDDWCAPLGPSGVAHRVEVREGGPALVLIAVADEVGARMIVVGPRGGGGFPGLALGSVGVQLAQHAHRPVTIVRA